MDYAFHFYNSMAETGIMMALEKCLGETDAPPVVLCIGSDLAVGDSLGPITGTMLRRRPEFRGFVYGTLNAPVTAKEVKYINNFLKKTHPFSKIIAVDAAVGEDSDVGLVKVSNQPLRPGSGANKRLGKVGDVSILGIVAKKSSFSYSVLNLTRLNVVYSMAQTISDALSALSSLKKHDLPKSVNE
ncbi:MAG: spore protease YyaC [Clostridia bacterium]|nr:spore protease YyaC [Clostridia bacterium]